MWRAFGAHANTTNFRDRTVEFSTKSVFAALAPQLGRHFFHFFGPRPVYLRVLEGSYAIGGSTGLRNALAEVEARHMQVTTAMSEALGKYLDLTADQMKLTAGNVANIDTPGFKTQGFDFEKEFANAMQGSMANDGMSAIAQPQVGIVDGLVARPDGNTVSMDRESLQLSKSQLQFRAGIALLKGEYAQVMAAIHMDK
jgi:flagellar basal-body rod protein FlgB